MAEVESTKYTNDKRDKKRAEIGRFNQPTQFHPDRAVEHERELSRKYKDGK
jgi:hypothetical protein